MVMLPYFCIVSRLQKAGLVEPNFNWKRVRLSVGNAVQAPALVIQGAAGPSQASLGLLRLLKRQKMDGWMDG